MRERPIKQPLMTWARTPALGNEVDILLSIRWGNAAKAWMTVKLHKLLRRMDKAVQDMKMKAVLCFILMMRMPNMIKMLMFKTIALITIVITTQITHNI